MDAEVPGPKLPPTPDLPPERTVQELASRLQELRRRAEKSANRRLSYRALANAIGYSPASYGNWLTGKHLPNSEPLDDMLLYFGATAEEQHEISTLRDYLEDQQYRPVERTTVGAGPARNPERTRRLWRPRPAWRLWLPAAMASESAAAALFATAIAVFGGPAPVPGSVFVAAPASSCGQVSLDGFRSPAATAFSNVSAVGTLSITGVSAAVLQGTYRGVTYHWAESRPGAGRAGMQLRWASDAGRWHYCTVLVAADVTSPPPDRVATVAVPAAVSSASVRYQACIWHQRPFTEQCSAVF